MLSNLSKTAIILNYNKDKSQGNKELKQIVSACLVSDTTDKLDDKVDVQTVLLNYLQNNVSSDTIKEENAKLTLSNLVLADILIANDVFNHSASKNKEIYERFCNPQVFNCFNSVDDNKEILNSLGFEFTYVDVMQPLNENEANTIIDAFYSNLVVDYSCLNEVLDLLIEKNVRETNIPVNEKFIEYITTNELYQKLKDTNVFVLEQTEEKNTFLPEFILYSICNHLTKKYLIENANIHSELLVLYKIIKDNKPIRISLSIDVYRDMITKHYISLYKGVNFIKCTPENILTYKTKTCIKYIDFVVNEGE